MNKAGLFEAHNKMEAFWVLIISKEPPIIMTPQFALFVAMVKEE
jgi:competence transcription factor ComK